MFDHVRLFQGRNSGVKIVWFHPAGSNMFTEGAFARYNFDDLGCEVYVVDGTYAINDRVGNRHFFRQIQDDYVQDETVANSLEQARELFTQLREDGSKLMIGGYSNGGSFSAYCTLFLPELIDVCMDVAGYVPRTEEYNNLINGTHPVLETIREHQPELNIWHGVYDFVNQYSVTEQNVKDLINIEGLKVNFVSFKGGHNITPEFLDEFSKVCNVFVKPFLTESQ